MIKRSLVKDVTEERFNVSFNVYYVVADSTVTNKKTYDKKNRTCNEWKGLELKTEIALQTVQISRVQS